MIASEEELESGQVEKAQALLSKPTRIPGTDASIRRLVTNYRWKREEW